MRSVKLGRTPLGPRLPGLLNSMRRRLNIPGNPSLPGSPARAVHLGRAIVLAMVTALTVALVTTAGSLETRGATVQRTERAIGESDSAAFANSKLASLVIPTGGSPGEYAYVASIDGDLTLVNADTGTVLGAAQMPLCTTTGQGTWSNCLPLYNLSNCDNGTVNDTFLHNLNMSPNGVDLYVYVAALGPFDCGGDAGGEFVFDTATGVFQSVDSAEIPDQNLAALDSSACPYWTSFTASGSEAYMVPPSTNDACLPSDDLYTISAAHPNESTGPITLQPDSGETILQLGSAPDGTDIAALESDSGDTFLGIFDPSTGAQLSSTNLGDFTPATASGFGPSFYFVPALNELVVLTSGGQVETITLSSPISSSSVSPPVAGQLAVSADAGLDSTFAGNEAWFSADGGETATLTQTADQGFAVGPDGESGVFTFQAGVSSGAYVDTVSLASGSPVVTQVTVGGVGSPWNQESSDFDESIEVAYDDASVGAPIGGIIEADEMYGGGGGLGPWACPCQSQSGSPINTEDGDFYEAYDDLNIPTTGPPLEFTRTYDALMAKSEIDGDQPGGPFGYGWTDNWATSLQFSEPSAGDITVVGPNGAENVFEPQSGSPPCKWPYQIPAMGGTYCALPRVIGALTTADGGYQLTLGNGTAEEFNSSTGRLTSITNVQGQSLSLAYGGEMPGSGECPSTAGSCETVTSAGGEVLTIGWSASGESGDVTSVTDPDGNRWVYGYCTSDGSTCNTGQLISATNPGGEVTRYTYDVGSSQSDLQYDLTSVQPPTTSAAITAGEITTFCNDPSDSSAPVGYEVNCYNSAGEDVAQSTPSGATTTFSYSQMTQSTGWGTVTATDGDGVTTGYSFQGSELWQKSVGSTGSAPVNSIFNDYPTTLAPQSMEDGESNLTVEQRDANGNVLLSTDGAGNASQHAYNTDNQVYCSMDAADYLNGVSCPSSPSDIAMPAPGAPDENEDDQSQLGMDLSFYNSSNELVGTTDALGNTTVYAYTPSGGGVPSGLLYCTIDPVDYQKSVTCPSYGSTKAGASTSTFDSKGDVTSTTDADGHTTTYVYDAPHNPGLVSSETAPDGTVTTYTYDAEGSVLTMTVALASDSYSATTQFAYTPDELAYCTLQPAEYATGTRCPSSPPSSTPPPNSDPYPGATITIYNTANQPTYVINPLGGVTQTAYDSAGNVYCTVSPINYDGKAAGESASVSCPTLPITAPSTGSPGSPNNDLYKGATITIYNPDEQVSELANPLGALTSYAYDAAGNVLTTTVAPGATYSTGNPDPAPNIVTTYAYNGDNQVDKTTVGSATTAEYYDPNGNVYCAVSAKVYVPPPTTAYQCPPWEATWISSPPPPTTLYSSSPSPSQANNVTTTFYNADGKEVETTNPDVETSVTAYDGDGHTYCTSDPVNVGAWLSAHPSSVYPYLCPGSPPSSPPATGSDPGYTTAIYDDAGLTLSTTNQLGDTTDYTYDSAGLEATMTDPSGEETTFCYYYQSCASGATTTGSGAALYFETPPGLSTTDYGYFPGGAVDTTTSLGGTETDAYNAMGDLSAKTYSGTESGYSTPANVSYGSFYADGMPETMTDGTGTTTYHYDATDDLTDQAFSAGSGSGLTSNTVSYTYYSTAQLETVVYPSYSGHTSPTAIYTYDNLGNEASVTDWLGDEVEFSHDGDGNLTGESDLVGGPQKDSTTFSYDDADEETEALSDLTSSCTLTQNFKPSGQPINADGQLAEALDSYAGCSSNPSYETNYSYDQAGQVVYEGTTAQGSNPADFTYNAAGFPTEISSPGNVEQYSQTPNSSEAVTQQKPNSGYDGVTTTYGYDSLGDLITATTSSSATDYSYDSIGQMTSFVAAGDTTAYQYNGNDLEAATKTSAPQWTTVDDIDASNSFFEISCTSQSFCAAVDSVGNAFTWNGSSWTREKIDSPNALTEVSCTSSTFCAAVDDAGNAFTWNGSSWTEKSIDGTNIFYGASCTSSTFCAAVDDAGNAFTWNGSGWTKKSIDGTTALNQVSCTSSTFCAAVDDSGNAFTWNGSSWTKKSIDGTKALNQVSCTSSTFCAAVDGAGNAFTWNGSTWTKESIDGTNLLEAVSCANSTLCAAVDDAGNAFTWNGSSWTKKSIDGTTIFDAVSCVGSSSCVAVDQDGNAFMWNAYSWTKDNIDGTNAFYTVSCSSSTWCVAADDDGHVVRYANSTLASSQLTWGTPVSSLPSVLADGTNDYLYGPTGEPVEQMNVTSSPPSNNPVFLTYTPTDSTWLVTSTSGAQVAFYRYDAYGTPVTTGAQVTPFGFAGQYTDAASELEVMRARYYQPQTGEFTTLDPDFSETGVGYAYAGGDPVNGSDPTGLWCILGHNPNGSCRGSGAVVSAWHDTDQAWDCVTAACYSTKQGAANLLAGAHNSFNYIAGLPPVSTPYPCYDAGAYALGGQLPYAAAFALAPGIGELEAIEAASADAAEGGTGASISDILEPGGNLIGKAGTDVSIRELSGGLPEAQSMFDQLSQGGTVVEQTPYLTRVQLPDGGFVQLRTVMSQSPNTAATIDVNIPGVNITKLKFNP